MSGSRGSAIRAEAPSKQPSLGLATSGWVCVLPPATSPENGVGQRACSDRMAKGLNLSLSLSVSPPPPLSVSQAGRRPVIGFDMGGTSTDVSRYDGAYEQVRDISCYLVDRIV